MHMAGAIQQQGVQKAAPWDRVGDRVRARMAQSETQLQAEEKAARDSGAAASAIGAPRQHRVMSSLANTTGSDDAAGVAAAVGGKGSASSGASAGANLAGMKGGNKKGKPIKRGGG